MDVVVRFHDPCVRVVRYRSPCLEGDGEIQRTMCLGGGEVVGGGDIPRLMWRVRGSKGPFVEEWNWKIPMTCVVGSRF